MLKMGLERTKPPVELLLLLLIQRHCDMSKSLFKNVGQISNLGFATVRRSSIHTKVSLFKHAVKVKCKIICTNTFDILITFAMMLKE